MPNQLLKKLVLPVLRSKDLAQEDDHLVLCPPGVVGPRTVLTLGDIDLAIKGGLRAAVLAHDIPSP
jgi:hypothetical protein